jgi:catechol 2,3-dioxygenase-like lactoylglutathione lyase family enzyme
MSIKRIVPIVKVTDLQRAIDVYCSLLGFRKDFEHARSPEGPFYVGISRDGNQLHLSTFFGDGVIPSTIYFYVDDVDMLYASFRKAGLREVDLEPTNQTWGRREFYIRDPDGNALRFGQ